jgi:hypothetical protein
VFSVLITEASSKHCLPLQRHIRAALPDVVLTGHDTHFYPLCKHYGYLNEVIRRVPLETVLAQRQFDMVVPVGAQSVFTVAQCSPTRAAIPSAESIATCFDKHATVMLGNRLQIPTPLTVRITSMDELAKCSVPYPCVIKPTSETEAKRVCYAESDADRVRHVASLLAIPAVASGHGVLVQEKIVGTGVGFFALFDHGEPKRIFMHRRLREYPITGGASTAACAYYDETLKDYGVRILRELAWHGVAMVEFKHDPIANRFVLMEINPKFWGSVELALEAGVNFGADLIRVFRGEQLAYCESYDRDLHFYWPLDGDLVHLLKVHQISRVRDYAGPRARTNLGYSRIADVLKTLRMFAGLLHG